MAGRAAEAGDAAGDPRACWDFAARVAVIKAADSDVVADSADSTASVEAVPVEDALTTSSELPTGYEEPFPTQEPLALIGKLDVDGSPLIAFDEPAAADSDSATADHNDEMVFADTAIADASAEVETSDTPNIATGIAAGPVVASSLSESPSEVTEAATASASPAGFTYLYSVALERLTVGLIAVWIAGSVFVVLTTIVRVR